MSGFGGSSGENGGSITISNPIGNRTKSQSISVTLSTDEPNILVSGTVTSNIGTTNGLALDDNLTNLREQIPSTLGQKNSNNSLSVVLSSDQSSIPVISTFNNAITDSFSRLRISQPKTLFDSKQLADSQSLFWDDQQTSGSGTSSTFLTNQGSTRMSVSNATAGTRIRQTFQRFNYQPGESMIVILTGILGVVATGITRRIGYFDESNGVFFQLSGNTLSTVIRSNVTGTPTDTVVNQNDWNIDKLDGSGTSSITIDTSKIQIFTIDFQWLGAGRIRFGFCLNGDFIYAHQIFNSNTLSTVWSSVPNLPIRYEISNSGSGTAANLIHTSSAVITEGGTEKKGFILTADRGTTPLTTNNDTNIYPLMAMRLKSNYRMATVEQLLFSILATSNTIYRYCILLNPTVNGTELSFTSVSNSAVEVQTNTTNSTTVSGGIQVLSGYVDASSHQDLLVSEIPTDLRLGSSISGVSDILVLAVQKITGTTETFYCSMTWAEKN